MRQDLPTRRDLSPTMRRPLVTTRARRVKDAFRYMRSRCDRIQTDETIRGYAKALLSSERAKDVERLLAVSFDAMDRGATVEQAELPFRLMLASVRNYQQGGTVIGSIGDLCMAETIAQSRLEQAECAFSHDQANPFLARKYVEARSAYFRESGGLNELAERIAATG